MTKEFEIDLPSISLSNRMHVVNVDSGFISPTLLQLGAVGRTLQGDPLYARYGILDLDQMFPEVKVGVGFVKNRNKEDSTIGELASGAYGVMVSREYGFKGMLLITDPLVSQGMLCSNYKNNFSQAAHRYLGVSCKTLFLPTVKMMIHVKREENDVADMLSKLHMTKEVEKHVTEDTIKQKLADERDNFHGILTHHIKSAKAKCSNYIVTKGSDFDKLQEEALELISRLIEPTNFIKEYAGNLNEAVNAHFSEGDRIVMQEAPVATAPLDDLMDIDDPTPLVHRGPSSLFSATRGMNPFSLPDPTFPRGLFHGPDIFNRTSELIEQGRAPFVSQPRVVRQIPIEVRDGPDNSATQPGHGPRIEDVTDAIDVEGSEMHGPVIVDEEDDEDITRNYRGITRPSVPQFDDSADYGNDIEEEMFRAAIEASKRDAELQNNNEGLDYVEPQQRASQHDDTDIAHAVSLSLRTAEQEKTQRGPVLGGGVSGLNADRPINVGELANVVTRIKGKKQGVR